MKNQALFSSKNKNKKKLKCRLLQFLFGTLRINTNLKCVIDHKHLTHNPGSTALA